MSNEAAVEPAATVTEDGVVNAALSSDSETTVPPAGAALVRVTVQLAVAFAPRPAGLQTRAESTRGATRLTAALCEAPLSVAVTVALWSVGIVPVVALNVPEVEPANTVTEVGVVKTALLFDTVTAVPPAGAALVSVTVQVPVAFGPRVVGLHANPERATGATRLMVTFCDAPLSVAVTVALWSVGIELVVALNVAEVELAGTITEVGAVNMPLLFDTVTMAPLTGADLVRVTVQVLLAPGPRLVGLHAKVESAKEAARFNVTLCEAPFSVAVTVALWSVGIALVVALNVAEVEPAATVTEVGAVKTPLLFDTVTRVPPAGAALVSVTVQVLEAFGPRLVGLHASAESATEAARFKVTLCEAPFNVAVTVPL